VKIAISCDIFYDSCHSCVSSNLKFPFSLSCPLSPLDCMPHLAILKCLPHTFIASGEKGIEMKERDFQLQKVWAKKESIQAIVNLKANEEGTFKCHLKCNLCFNRIIVNFFRVCYEAKKNFFNDIASDYDKDFLPSFSFFLWLAKATASCMWEGHVRVKHNITYDIICWWLECAAKIFMLQ
jgi:hypothetical protein